MVAAATFQILGNVFTVRCAYPQPREYLCRVLHAFRASVDEEVDVRATYDIRGSDDPDRPFTLLRDGQEVNTVADVARLVDFILWESHAMAVASITEQLALHAAAVSWNGGAIVLPGEPDAGKTTLAAALTHAGYTYLTDETAILSLDDGVVHPYARPLWLEPPSIDLIPGLRDTLAPDAWSQAAGNIHVRPEQLCSTTSRPVPVPLKTVIFPRYEAGTSTGIEPMSRAEALVGLMKNSFNSDQIGREAVPALAMILRGVDCYRLTTGRLGSAVDAIADLVMWPAWPTRHSVQTAISR